MAVASRAVRLDSGRDALETAVHSGHLETARELLDGKTRLGGR
jgi:hypothetical protein